MVSPIYHQGKYLKYKEIADSTMEPTIFINAPIYSPFVKGKNDSERREVKIIVDGKSFYHGYIDENDPDIIVSEFEKQKIDLAVRGIDADLPKDYIHLLQYGAPVTISFGFGFDRFLTSFLKKESIQEIVHLIGV